MAEEGAPTEPMADYDTPNEGSGGSDGEGSTVYESPSPLYPSCTKRQRIEQSEPDYNLDDEILPRRSNRRRQFDEAAAAAAIVSAEEVHAPASSSKQMVKKIGKRKKNKLTSGIYQILAISKEDGSPIEPEGVLAHWRNDCGVFVREKGKIVWDDWKKVDDKEKERLWQFVKAKYIFPPEFLESGKNATLQTLGKCLRTFRYNLDREYIKTGKTPFQDYGYISRDDWNTFVQQRTSERALALSKSNIDLNKKNKIHHNLGPGGYKAKIPKWRKKEQEDRTAGIPDEYEGCTERTKNWLYARLKKDANGKLVPKNSEVSEVVQKAKKVQKGSQAPNDQLTVVLGNEEHRGRTRGVSSKASWKKGFPDGGTDAEADFKKWCSNFWMFVHRNPNVIPKMAVPECNLSLNSEQHMSNQQFASSAPSSAGSATDTQKYPVDNIVEDTPCSLLVPFGNKGKTKKVAEGIAMVGRKLHTRDIPVECARVQVLRITDKHFLKDELDYPMEEEGIETLEDAVNNFILWHRRDIIINTVSALKVSSCSGSGA